MTKWFDLNSKGLKEFKNDLTKLKEEAEKLMKKAVEENAKMMVADIKRNTPVDTGLLRGDFNADNPNETFVADEVTEKNGVYSAEVYTNNEYAPYVEYGHRVTPHFVPGEFKKGRFVYNPDAKGGIYVGKKTRFVKGHFMVYNAEKRAQRRLDKAAREISSKVLGKIK